MDLATADPIAFFNSWLKDVIHARSGDSVLAVMNALNQHELAHDETAQDYIMPPRRYKEQPGRFRVFGENQDAFYCFVSEGDEFEVDPPVYFETYLDLKLDYGFNEDEVIDDHCMMVCPRFSAFLWHMLGHQICIRLKGNGLYRSGVHGITFRKPVELGRGFMNPLNSEFPAGYTCYFARDVICVPDWGAAFRNDQAHEAFLAEFRPQVDKHWA
jgi:hypothetical protein